MTPVTLKNVHYTFFFLGSTLYSEFFNWRIWQVKFSLYFNHFGWQVKIKVNFPPWMLYTVVLQVSSFLHQKPCNFSFSWRLSYYLALELKSYCYYAFKRSFTYVNELCYDWLTLCSIVYIVCRPSCWTLNWYWYVNVGVDNPKLCPKYAVWKKAVLRCYLELFNTN